MSEILIEQIDQTLHLTLNRPEKKNAITQAMYMTLANNLNAAAGDFAIRTVVISGNGKAFTAGNDIMDFMNEEITMSSPVFHFLKAIHEFPKPLIAAVQGNAVGIGTTMLLHCDLVYAAADALFAMPFVTLGLVPEAGSSLLFPRLVGHAKASEIFMTGRSFGSAEALEMGLINSIEESPTAKALEVAALIADQPPSAVLNTKALLKSGSHIAVENVMLAEGEMFRIALQSDETQGAFMKFMTSRKKD
ncbi:MAG: enoyl-CoA hydratase [Actinomycetes bacterium]|jgi:enoyl-CoA hydratase/carnithine racemase